MIPDAELAAIRGLTSVTDLDSTSHRNQDYIGDASKAIERLLAEREAFVHLFRAVEAEWSHRPHSTRKAWIDVEAFE